MEFQQKVKEQSLDFIKRQINRGEYSYPIFESLTKDEIYTNLNGLPLQKAKAIVLYVGGTLINNNDDFRFLHNNVFEPYSLSSRTLKNLFGNDYSLYLKYFSEQNILRRLNYEVGVYSFKFSIHEAYHRDKLVYRQLTHSGIVRSLKRYYFQMFTENRKLYTSFSNSIYWYTTGKLKNQCGYGNKYS